METQLSYNKLIADMSSCEQTKGMSVYEHGQLVNDYYNDFLHYMKTGVTFHLWKMPTWVDQYGHEIMSNLLDYDTMSRYQIHHDCGKPYCRCVDEDGKIHFPDHANVSADVWSKLFPDDKKVIDLIRNDMVIHTIKSDELLEFTKNPLAVSLLITGLCEIHANASMFGGIESTSFKIKWKQIDRRGKQVVSNLAIH